MIPEHIKNVCKIGQGDKCCKYIVMATIGFQCMKVADTTKKLIDNNWNDTKSAQGDNCEGRIDIN